MRCRSCREQAIPGLTDCRDHASAISMECLIGALRDERRRLGVALREILGLVPDDCADVLPGLFERHGIDPATLAGEGE